MGAAWSCGSLTFAGQVWSLPFILVSTSAQLCKGYLSKCYKRHKWQVCASRCSGLLLHTKSAKDITACWWWSRGEYICYLICLFDFTEPFHLPLLSEAQKNLLKWEKTRSFNLMLVSRESCFSCSNKWPKWVLLNGIRLEREWDKMA